MKKTFTLLCTLLFLVGNITWAQKNCASGRYSQPIFSQIDSVKNIQYGQNYGDDGTTLEKLVMDIYWPLNDANQSRPVILLAHGGSFIGGDKKSMQPLCRKFAKMGYVTATISYRLTSLLVLSAFGDLEEGFRQEVVRAIQDMKSAVRFLRKSAIDGGNPYGIDPNVVIVGGESAGAIMSNQVTYLDNMTEAANSLPQTTIDYINNNGGLEGNASGPLNPSDVNEGYSSVPQMDISFCGAIMDTSWIEAGDQPYYGVHTMADSTVKPLKGYPLGGFVKVNLYGDSLMYMRMQNVGVPSGFENFSTGGHCAFGPNYLVPVIAFMKDQICNQNLGLKENAAENIFTIYPNPSSSEVVTIGLPSNSSKYRLQISDMSGKIVYSTRVAAHKTKLNIKIDKFPSGIYNVRLTNAEGQQSTQKLVIQ